MDDNRQFDGQGVFTIGHSNHGLEQFATLLKDNRIEVIVDIRSKPYSRYATQFNKATIQDFLHSCGIKYLYLGDKLGGKPDDRRFYDTEGNVVYSRISETPEFHEGIERVTRGSKDWRVALMCSEEDPSNCHRYNLVSGFLEERGITVTHIRGDGRHQSRDDLSLEKATKMNGKKQLNLFQMKFETGGK
jgi:uncharacterized protein (DUF488 family)